MATSESDDFESADEEMNHDIPTKSSQMQQWNLPNTIDSESDDDTEYVPRQPYTNVNFGKNKEKYWPTMDTSTNETRADKDISTKDTHNYKKHEQPIINVDETCEKNDENISTIDSQKVECAQINTGDKDLKVESNNENIELRKNKVEVFPEKDVNMDLHSDLMDQLNKKGKIQYKGKKLRGKKLETKVMPSSNLLTDIDNIDTRINERDILMTGEDVLSKYSMEDEITESDMPEELKSDKTFKEVFKSEGWEGLEDPIELPEELIEEKLQPVLKRLSLVAEETSSSSTSWGWGNWGVSSLINTASVGVSTITSHVSQGLTLLEESMALSDEPKSITNEEQENQTDNDGKEEQTKEQSSFGFGNLISSVSSITKLVESTGSKVVSGGLDTLEAIGKKTMEVLQEGDPGLKKKRTFFINETDKPNLSQILREAKEKADSTERTMEERQKMRKVHFESLFDDYQGLVHIEALEMLSKQSNIKIQQHLNSLDTNELNSVEKMLEEVEELCALDNDDEYNDETDEKDLKYKLQEACSDLGINITYEKLHEAFQDSKNYTTSPHSDQETFEHAISVLAQFTAFSVERFHKTAELLLIKEHRSTVNETDSLVQLTNILSNQIEILANTYCSVLNKLAETSDKSHTIKTNITTILMEASNASSYIQHAFKLLIPIIEVGAI
ncbi:protein FAM114A2 [Bombus vosnesenskii]|uniref:Protein FAM114A2 n=1 Tax=Bombus vosnesenskii TaxID=207650 RepID=A0A6J3JZE7_9HYME|nr:protein FAM114A2 [Bombus vosnesenskii]XP_033345454.1 protein FAM114A2 [Bombus vosnesenskii]